MVAEQREQKITYTTMGFEQAEAFNRAYGEALERISGQLGKTYPAYINNEPRVTQRSTFESRSPNDQRILLGTFQ